MNVFAAALIVAVVWVLAVDAIRRPSTSPWWRPRPVSTAEIAVACAGIAWIDPPWPQLLAFVASAIAAGLWVGMRQAADSVAA